MAFSCMAVIGNASLVKTEIAYDSIDDAALSPEQVADLALDKTHCYSHSKACFSYNDFYTKKFVVFLYMLAIEKDYIYMYNCFVNIF